MMNTRHRKFGVIAIVLFAILAAFACPLFAETFDYQQAIDNLRTDELREHLAWLADKAQEGRAAGTDAARRTADYLVERLQQLGLKPAGGDGTYLQGFRFNQDGKPRFRNVLGIIPGSDEKLSQEYIVLCAHFDHVGVMNGDVYCGANDNASGTSMLLELAESLQKLEPKPKRSILIAFWDAEEMGLFGSRHFVKRPTIPLEKIVLAFNFDMVGTLQNNSFEIFGTNIATGTREYISRTLSKEMTETSEMPDIEFSSEYVLASDHSSFYLKKIPALMFFTGLDCPYHSPEDTINVINFDGMKQIADMAFRIVYRMANDETLTETVHYLPLRTLESNWSDAFAQPSLGITYWENIAEPDTLIIGDIDEDSNAERVGLEMNDRIYYINGNRANAETFNEAIESGKPYSVEMERHGKLRKIEVLSP